ncbi:MAG: hypothetical protein H6703_05765 [Myxococcales bacterium]|nr:hypothetical protein [Myxococcales bacterium]
MRTRIALTAAALLTTLTALTALTGCEDSAAPTALTVERLSTAHLVVGHRFEAWVLDPAAVEPDDRSALEDATAITLRFEGRYRTDDGREEDVARDMPALYDGRVDRDGAALHALRVSRFGPFDNPFTATGRPGTFDGTVRFVATTADGLVIEPARPTPVTLAVGASILIESLEPIDAGCGAPAMRALPGLAYRIAVRAVGIRPVRFVWQLSRVNGVEGTREFIHAFDGPTERDVLGEDEAVIWNPVPDAQQFYAAGIRVIAIDDKGNEIETALPLTVHRPIEIVHSGKRELAERYTPVPVSGCTPGSIGSRVSYSETRTEYRQKSVSVTISQEWTASTGVTATMGWQEGFAEGQSESESFGGVDREEERLAETWGLSYGTSESNSMNLSTTDGESWSWSRREGESNTDYEETLDRLYGEGSWSGTVGATAEGSVPGFAKVTGSVSTTAGVRAGGAVGDSAGESRTRSSDRGFSMSGTRSETEAFGSTVTDTTSENVSGSFALTRARQRSFNDTASRERGRTWNFGQSVQAQDLVTEGITESEQRTWVSSASDQTVQAFSGIIPRTKVGIFYRQTTRWVRRAEVRAYDQCGLSQHLGELQFNEWTWAPDLAIGDACGEQPPPPGLDAAACFIEPCG